MSKYNWNNLDLGVNLANFDSHTHSKVTGTFHFGTTSVGLMQAHHPFSLSSLFWNMDFPD